MSSGGLLLIKFWTSGRIEAWIKGLAGFGEFLLRKLKQQQEIFFFDSMDYKFVMVTVNLHMSLTDTMLVV